MPKRKAIRGKRGGTVGSSGDKTTDKVATNECDEMTENAEGDNSQENVSWSEGDEGLLDVVSSNSKLPDELSEAERGENSHALETQAKSHFVNTETVEVTKCTADADHSEQQQVLGDNIGSKNLIASVIEKELETEAEPCPQNIEFHESGGLADPEEKSEEKEENVLEKVELSVLETVDEIGDVELINMDFFQGDKEVIVEDREEEEVQYIDEEADEDQLPPGVNNASDKKSTESKKQKVNDKIAGGSRVESSHLEGKESSGQAQEIYDDKFEEISEGSIGLVELEEILNESLSDVEIVHVSPGHKSKNAAGKARDSKGKTKRHNKEADSLEEVFVATENDDVRITAEDKDNDDISDASLSDHVDDNLSLEEISDDDLEPSKRKRKSSGPGLAKDYSDGKVVSINANAVETGSVCKPEEKSDSKPYVTSSLLAFKRAASEDLGSSEASSVKKLKPSAEKTNNEKHPSNSNEPAFTTGICGNTQKSRPTQVDSSHGTRNPQHMTSQEQNQRKERSLSSRDHVERKNICVNSSSQTEPQQLKGKIVQCNINPVLPTAENQVQESPAVTTKLHLKFKHLLPSSIPEMIFADITSLQPAKKGDAYTFRMGPVTLSDMDSPEFRDVALRGAEKFGLAFDHHRQGIFKATMPKQEDVVSLIRQLKRLELGNRYMVMSVLHKPGGDGGPAVLKATIMFMYEQDIQMASQGLVSDGKMRARLSLHGVPKGVSKDFIHVLFPEALTVSTGPGADEERIVTLGFSNTKMVEEICSCYDLLVINGSQITIAQMDRTGELQDTELPPEELGVVIIEDIAEDEAKEKDVAASTTSGPISDSPPEETAAVSAGKGEVEGFQALDQERKLDTDKDESQRASESPVIEETGMQKHPSSGGPISEQTVSDMKVIHIADNVEKEGHENSAQNATEIAQGILESIIDAVTDKAEEQAETASEMENEKSTAGKSVMNQNENISIESEEESLKNKDVLSEETQKETYNCDKSTEPQTAESQDTVGNEVGQSYADKNVELQPVKVVDTIDVQTMQHEDVISSLGQAGNEQLEDVSDDEMATQVKDACDHDDVVIVGEASSKRVVANIDLTVEEISAKENMDHSTGDPSSFQTKEKETNIGEKERFNSGKNGDKSSDGKLVIMDGNFEVSMEVEDVRQEEMTCEGVLYPRQWNPSQNIQKDKQLWDRVLSPPNSKEPQGWSAQVNVKRSYQGTMYRRPLPTTEPSRMSHNYRSGSPRENSLKFPVPSREETVRRREHYPYEHKRSPSPKRKDLTWYRDLDKHQQSRPTHSSDYYRNTGRKYSSGDQWGKGYDKWESSYHGESRRAPIYHGESNRTESFTRPPAEPSSRAEASSRQNEWQIRNSPYYSSSTWQGDTHSSIRPRDHYTYNDTKGPHYSHRKFPRGRSRSHSQSLSDMSISSHSRSPARGKAAVRRKSQLQPPLHAPGSPISVSSRSRSLSPISKSPTPKMDSRSKEALVETVKHILHLAKGIEHNKQVQYSRSKSPKPHSSRHSNSPQPFRPRSPKHSSGQAERYVYRKPQHSPSPQRVKHLRSPPPSWSRHSRSPRRHGGRHDRSISPVSSIGSSSRGTKESSYRGRRRSPKEEDRSRRYDSKWSRRPGKGLSPQADQPGRSTSGQWSDQKNSDQYRYSGDQSWYQQRSGSDSVPVFNPAYPPPSYPPGNPHPPPQQYPSVYSAPSGSVPTYSYNAPPPSYGYSNNPAPTGSLPQSAPAPHLAQAYQQAFTILQSAMASHTSSQGAPPSSEQGSSRQPNPSSEQPSFDKKESSSNSKKSWSLGSNAMVFQRILGKDGGKVDKSGAIQKVVDRERVERPKIPKERVLTSVPVQKK